MAWTAPTSPTPGASTRPPALPVLLGALVGIAVQLLVFVVLIRAALSSDNPDPAHAAFMLSLIIPGAFGVALACGVAARVCRWRTRNRDLTARALNTASVLASLLTATVIFVLGLFPALGWKSLPLFFLGVALGTGIEHRWGQSRSTDRATR